MTLSLTLSYLHLLLVLLHQSLGRYKEEGKNVIYPELGTLTHVVYISSKVGQCSGALLSESFVLTAAHCLSDERKGRAGNTDIKVTAGIIDIMKTDLYSQDRTSKEVILHPNFWPGKLAGFDLALIRLSVPFNLSEAVFQIELWDKGWPQNGSQSMICQASGFGALDDPQNTRLRMWDVVALHGEHSCPCTKRFQWKRLVCTEPEDDDPELCRGDSGGALVCGDKAVAIAHMTRERQTCEHLAYARCDKPRPSLNIFMYLCPYNDWIRYYVPEVPPTPKSCRGCKTFLNWNTFVIEGVLVALWKMTVFPFSRVL